MLYFCTLQSSPFMRKMECYFCECSKPTAFLALIKVTGFEEILKSLDPYARQLAKTIR